MNTSSSSNRQTKAREAASAIRWSILTATVLMLVKLVAGIMTHSMAVFASMLDSLLDVATSAVNLFASIKAAKPPDEDHAYGHEKIESLASLFQSGLIMVSGLFLVVESIKRFFKGSHLDHISMGLGVMVFSIVMSLLLAWKLRDSAAKSRSMILSTEVLHYSMDALSNGGALVALVLVRATGLVFWDLLFSLLIAGYIFKTAFGILHRAIDELLDHSLPPVSVGEIEKIIRSFNPAIVSFHNFRSRRVGEQIFMDFHIEIRGEDNFSRAHDMTEGLIARIQEWYPGADITVHYDPEGAI